MSSFLYNPFLILIILCLYLRIVTLFKPAYYHSLDLGNKRINKGIILIFLFSLYDVQDTDYFHYIEVLNTMEKGGNTHLEEVYFHIASLSNFQNIPFRIIVWGSALLLFIFSIKRLRMSLSLVLFFFSALFIMKFSYARVSLAMSLGLLGYTFFISPFRIKILSAIIGGFLVFLSFYFHKSAYFWIVIFICSAINLNKSIFRIFLLIYPLGVFLCQKYGVENLLSSTSEDLAENASGYMNMGNLDHGLNYYVRILLSRTPYYLLLYAIYYSVISNKYQYFEKFEKHIINVCFYIIYFSSFFLLDIGVNTSVMYYRFLYYSILPLSLMMEIFYTKGIKPQLIKYSVTLGFWACVYDFVYSFYNAII